MSQKSGESRVLVNEENGFLNGRSGDELGQRAHLRTMTDPTAIKNLTNLRPLNDPKSTPKFQEQNRKPLQRIDLNQHGISSKFKGLLKQGAIFRSDSSEKCASEPCKRVSDHLGHFKSPNHSIKPEGFSILDSENLHPKKRPLDTELENIGNSKVTKKFNRTKNINFKQDFEFLDDSSITELTTRKNEPESEQEESKISENLTILKNDKSSAKPVVNENLKSKNDIKSTVDRIVRRLGLDDSYKAFANPITLYQVLEKEGKLSPKALGIFSKCPGIKTLLLSPSYGETVNEIGLSISGPYSVLGCTVSIFRGFQSVKVLDLACAPIGDEDLRYIIRLKSLEALGLSGTKISSRGIRYLGRHAIFSKTLQCLKLCYVQSIDDAALSDIYRSFPALTEVDFYGIKRITMNGLVRETPRSVCRLRVPEAILDFLSERHATYVEISRRKAPILQISEVKLLSREELRAQLNIHHRYYPDVYLNIDQPSQEARLIEILTRRHQEEYLYLISQD